MCAIIGWYGKLPTGALYKLLHEAKTRGVHSTGIAYWSEDNDCNKMCKLAAPSTKFTDRCSQQVNDAQRSEIGIAHTRNASPGMPIDSHNAHPFIWKSYVYAHNGFVKNWKSLKCFFENSTEITTDSMVLGPKIETLDFSDVSGSLGLVWLNGEVLYFLRSKKELAAVKMVWNYEKSLSDVTIEKEVIIVASTMDIIQAAIGKVSRIKYKLIPLNVEEDVVYRVDSTCHENGPYPIVKIATRQDSEEDLFSSKIICQES